jgi:hypothetical protein
VKFTRWLVALGCVCLLAAQALADATVQDFSNPGVKGTNYAEYGSQLGGGYVVNGGPAGAPNFYRLSLGLPLDRRGTSWAISIFASAGNRRGPTTPTAWASA